MIKLCLNNVAHRYRETLALHPITLIQEGPASIALIGENGAGKSTLLRALVGAQRLSQGFIELNGELVFPESKQRSLIGYLSEHNPLLASSTVLEQLKRAAISHHLLPPKRTEYVENIIKLCELKALQHRYCETLSRGQRQRVGLASAMIHQPQVLILDELYSGLDPRQTDALSDLLREFARTTLIISSTHRLREAERFADLVWVLHKGKLLKACSIQEWKNEEINVEQINNHKGESTWSLDQAYRQLINQSEQLISSL